MRELWIKEPELGWDESIPEEYKCAWTRFFLLLVKLQIIVFALFHYWMYVYTYFVMSRNNLHISIFLLKLNEDILF